MKYSKKFNQDGSEVSIALKDGHFHIYDKHPASWTFKVVQKDDIYEQISKNKQIDLNSCYLQDFSYLECLKQFNLDRNTVLRLKNSTNIFFENVDFMYAKFCDGGVDFSRSHFAGAITNFGYAQFGEGHINFMETCFGEGEVNFTNTHFGKGSVLFNGAKFSGGKINFNMARFEDGHIFFSSAKFGKGDISFSGTQFGEGNVYFGGTSFEKGKVDFSNCKIIEGDLDFSKSQFQEGFVSFSNSNFGKGKVDFTDTQFGKGRVSFSGTKIKADWILKNIKADEVDFSNSMIHGTIDFFGHRTQISKLKLNETKLTGRIFIGSRELRLSKKMDNDNDAINSQEDSSHVEKAYQFRLLKENFRNLGQYDDEDWAYVQFKRNELLASKGVSNKFKYYFQKIIFESIGAYGTNPWRIVASMAITVVGFAIVYYLSLVTRFPFILKDGKLIEATERLDYSLYHSIITFLTIGYGDIQPGNLAGRLFSGAEGAAGLFLMSYFTVAFVRKILR